mgnify:FL=1
MNMFEEIEKTKAELPKAKTISNEIKNLSFNFYQIFAIFVFVIIFCLGILLGNLFPTCGSSATLYSGTCLTTEFNFSLMIFIWFVGLILSVFIFAIGHIIELLETLNERIKK